MVFTGKLPGNTMVHFSLPGKWGKYVFLFYHGNTSNTGNESNYLGKKSNTLGKILGVFNYQGYFTSGNLEILKIYTRNFKISAERSQIPN